MNPWSLVAVLCSIGLCPFFTIAAILLGVRALVDIKAKGDTRGVRLAWFAILFGSMMTGLWGGGMLWWNLNVRNRIENGPIQAIISAQNGDMTEFESSFVTPDSNEETSIFLALIHSRYGLLQSGELNPEMNEAAVDGSRLFLGMVPLESELAYVLHFTNDNEIHLTAKFELFKEVDGGKQFMNRFRWMRIHDEENGDLVYPVDVVMED